MKLQNIVTVAILILGAVMLLYLVSVGLAWILDWGVRMAFDTTLFNDVWKGGIFVLIVSFVFGFLVKR